MKFTVICFAIVFLCFHVFIRKDEQFYTFDKPIAVNQTSLKDTAFEVLKAKCNICHVTKKRTDIFTLENMDSLASEIHKQVFIKKKMPKGRKVKLTEEERQAIEKWVAAVLESPKARD